MTAEATQVRSAPIRTWLGRIGAGFAIAALYLWDDFLLAAPVVALTKTAGPVFAMLVASVAYSAVSTVLALQAVRLYERWTAGEPSRLAEWLDRQRNHRRAAWAESLIRTGGLVGFVASSFLLGGVVTTWLMRYAGRSEGIRRIAVASSVLFGVSFSAFYTGVASFVFSF